MAAKKLKPETLNMRGAAVRSLQTAYAHYLDYQKAFCEDIPQENVADKETFLDWVKDELT